MIDDSRWKNDQLTTLHVKSYDGWQPVKEWHVDQPLSEMSYDWWQPVKEWHDEL